MNTASRNPSRRLTARVLLAAATLGVFGQSQAQTYIHVYRLGEDDPNAAAGNPVNATTTDAGTTPVDLNRIGSGTTYSSVTPGSGSSLSASLNGSGNFSGSFSGTPDNNFGIEAWVRPTSTSTQFFFALGDSINNGLQIWKDTGNANYLAWVGAGSGGTNYPLSALSTDTWTHLAIVRDNDGWIKAFVDGQSFGNLTNTYFSPGSSPTFTIGASASNSWRVQGAIDHVRMFTFTGAFDVSMLAFPASAIPEPSTYAAVAGLAALGLAVWRRRR